MKNSNSVRTIETYAKSSDLALSNVSTKIISNKTPIVHKNRGKLSFICPICGITFERHACHAARRGQTECYCSVACSSFAHRKPTDCLCIVCGNKFVVAFSDSKRISCCSKECSSVRKQKIGTIIANDPKLRQKIKQIQIQNSIIKEFNGEFKTIKEFSKEWGISYALAWHRIKKYEKQNLIG